MLAQLTRYLLQFHQVYIPSLGTIRLVQQPAWLDVANKALHPPHFTLHFTEEGWLSKHQLWYFGTQLHFDDTATRHSLNAIGAQLKKSLEQYPFTWNGIGTFAYNNQTIRFRPQQHVSILQPITAERVLRENVQHSVRVGEQIVLSNGHSEVREAEERHWNWSRILGWATVILSLFFILFYLYQHQFNPTASGLHQRVGAEPPPATYTQ